MISFTLLASCENKTSKTIIPQQDDTTEVVDMHNSQISVDWPGSYFGVVPCASCPGIETMITLNEDETYEKTEVYKESDLEPFIEKGKILWTNNGNEIHLGESLYKVGENMLIMLDADGNEISGELEKNYILNKTQLQSALPINEGIELMEYQGSDNMKYQIIFNNNNSPATAVVSSKNLEMELTQKEAWAKGAEYVSQEASLLMKENVGEFKMGNKTIKLSEVK